MKRIFGFVVALLSLPALCLAGGAFEGHHCLAIGNDRSLQEARLLVHTLAIRRAIEGTGVLDELSGTWSSEEIGDMVQRLTSGVVKDVRILDHSETGDEVCKTVEIQADLDALKDAVRREIQTRTEWIEGRGLANNGYLKILAVQEDEDRYGRRVEAVARVLRSTGPLQVPEQRRRKPCFKVCIDFLGPGGVPLGGDARFIDETAEGTLSGEIRSLSFYVPREAQSYRVWLPNETVRTAARPKPTTRPAAPASAPPEAAGSADDGPERPIKAVEAVDGPDGLRVTVISDGPIERYRHFYMGDPPRLVIDLPGRWKQPRFHARRLDSPAAKRIRIGHHPGKLRLVLDLSESGKAPSAVIRETASGLSVNLHRP
jgi:hypothetical protein